MTRNYTWSKPLLSPLKKLSDANSKLIFETLGGTVDEFVEKLLKAIDGIPLAVTLVSALLQEGNESSGSLWTWWEKTQTTVVENGGSDRLSNLDTSIHLSVYGRRMQADPNTISILAMFSILPDGFTYPNEVISTMPRPSPLDIAIANARSEMGIDELQRHLPEGYHLREALLAMRRASLLDIDIANTPHRLRMLAPTRHFCEQRLETPEILRNGLSSFYIKIINDFRNLTDSVSHAVIPAELGNMRAVFVETCKRRRGDPGVVRACIMYTKWSLYIGNPVEEVICFAMKDIVGSPGLLGDCHYVLSQVYFSCARVDEAQASLEHAVELHRHACDLPGEANDVQRLGIVHLRRGKLDEAQVSLKHALELHRQVNNILGEADDVQKLGDVHLRRNQLDEAKASFQCAVKLHRQAHDVLGEAYDFQKLGDVHLRWNKLDDAQASFERTIEINRQGYSILGEACVFLKLGDVHSRQDKHDEAQASREHGIKLYREGHGPSVSSPQVRHPVHPLPNIPSVNI